MDLRFSLAHLTVLGSAPLEQIEIAADAGYDYASLRTTRWRRASRSSRWPVIGRWSIE